MKKQSTITRDFLLNDFFSKPKRPEFDASFGAEAFDTFNGKNRRAI